MTMWMPSKPKTILVSQALFIFNAVVWLIFGIASILRLADGSSVPSVTLWAIAILMLGNVGAMLIAGLWLGRQSRGALVFALAVLVVNIILTFTDQVGFFDLITALLDFAILGFLLFDRNKYL